jgi:hypothetical protein
LTNLKFVVLKNLEVDFIYYKDKFKDNELFTKLRQLKLNFCKIKSFEFLRFFFIPKLEILNLAFSFFPSLPQELKFEKLKVNDSNVQYRWHKMP